MGQPAVYGLTHYRFRNDDGSETAATWVAAIDTGATLNVDTNYRVRFVIDNHGATNGSPSLKWQRNYKGAGWSDLTSSFLKISLSGHFADGDGTTQQVGSGTFNAGEMDENASTGAISIPFGEETEVEFCLQVVGIDVDHNDTIELRAVETDGTVLGSYISPLPTITVNEPSETVEYPNPIVVTWTPQSVTLKEKITLSAVAATWSPVAPNLVSIVKPSSISATWTIPKLCVTAITQLAPHGLPMRQYGSFAGKVTAGQKVTPSSVVATWSVIVPTVKEIISPSPVSATWSVAAPSLKEVIKPATISATWSVPALTLISTVKPSVVSASWSVPAVTYKKIATPLSVVATWSVTAPALKESIKPSSLLVTWSVPVAIIPGAITPSPVIATWSVASPTLISTIKPSSVSASWSVAAVTWKKTLQATPLLATWFLAAPTLKETIQLSPVSITWSISDPTLKKIIAPSAISAAWSTVAPSLKSTLKASPISATWSVVIPSTVVATNFPVAVLQSGHYHIGA